MRMLKFILFVIVLCMCSNVYANSTEYWNTNIFKFSVTEDFTIKTVDQFRFEDRLNVFVRYVGLEHKLDKNISIAGFYKLVEKHERTGWIKSYLVVGDITVKQNVLPFVVSNRSRFEYGTTHSLQLYRNKVKVSLSPVYVDNEFFYKIKPDDGFVENRFSVGIESKSLFNSKISVFYMLRSKKHDSWKNSNIVGLTLKFMF